MKCVRLFWLLILLGATLPFAANVRDVAAQNLGDSFYAAQQMVFRGQFEEADQLLESLLEQLPRSGKLLPMELYVESKFRQEDYDAAEQAIDDFWDLWDRNIDRVPQDMQANFSIMRREVLLMQAYLHARNNDHDDARESVDEALEISADYGIPMRFEPGLMSYSFSEGTLVYPWRHGPLVREKVGPARWGAEGSTVAYGGYHGENFVYVTAHENYRNLNEQTALTAVLQLVLDGGQADPPFTPSDAPVRPLIPGTELYQQFPLVLEREKHGNVYALIHSFYFYEVGARILEFHASYSPDIAEQAEDSFRGLVAAMFQSL